MPTAPESPLHDIAAQQAALMAERLARQEAQARATGAEAMVAHLKLLIAKLKHDRFGASSERGRKLTDQLELELGDLVAAPSEDATKAENAEAKDRSSTSPTPRPLAGAPAARARGDRRAFRLPLLRWQALQARRGHHRDA